MPTTRMIHISPIIRIFGINVWFAPRLAWYNTGIGPKGWDDSNRLDDMVYRIQPTKAGWGMVLT